MKKITFLLVILLITTVSFGQELITNGGFETGDTEPFYGSGIAASTTEPYTGDWRLNLKNDWCHISQDITTAIGTIYTVSFYFRQAFEGADPTDFSLMWMKDDVGDRVGNLNELGMPMEYTNFTYTFEATSTLSTFYIQHPTRASGGSNNAVWVDDISIQAGGQLGIEDFAFDFGYYPNPAKDNLYFSAAKNIDNIAVYSLLGQEMLNLAKPGNSINVANLAKGVYIMEATIEGNTGSFKFIKE